MCRKRSKGLLTWRKRVRCPVGWPSVHFSGQVSFNPPASCHKKLGAPSQHVPCRVLLPSAASRIFPPVGQRPRLFSPSSRVPAVCPVCNRPISFVRPGAVIGRPRSHGDLNARLVLRGAAGIDGLLKVASMPSGAGGSVLHTLSWLTRLLKAGHKNCWQISGLCNRQRVGPEMTGVKLN